MITNNNIKKYSLTSSILLFITIIIETSSFKAIYQISKTYLTHQENANIVTNMGKLEIFQQTNINQVYIQPNFPILINAQELTKENTVILIFTNLETGKQFRTAVNKIVQKPHSQKIVVMMSSNEKVIGFNYVQTEVPNQDISVSLQLPEKGVDHVFKAQSQQKQVVQQQSFFSKYKYPLIIGAVILYMSMSGAGGAQNTQNQGQAAQH